MTPYQTLCEQLIAYPRLAIAFSGGTDSTFLAETAIHVLGYAKVLLIHADSPLITAGEKKYAKDYLNKTKARSVILTLDPFAHPLIYKNGKERCYHCKKTILSEMILTALNADFQILADGTNADDRSRQERPGLRALAELCVVSPLADAGLTKSDIRSHALSLGLPNALSPEAACLATRIPHDTSLTPENLLLADRAEEILHYLNFYDCRVRIHAPDQAVIELQTSDIVKIEFYNRLIISQLQDIGIKNIQFKPRST